MTNIPYKLLVVDVDGTLVDKDGNISDEDRKALDQVRERGVRISLSTGRTIQACFQIMNQLSLDGYHIFFDGALVSSPENSEQVYVQPLESTAVKKAVEFAHVNNIYFELYSVNSFFVERETWATEIRRRFFKIEPIIVEFSGIWEREKLFKAQLVTLSSEEVAKAGEFHREFKEIFGFSWARTPAYPGVDFINVVDHEASKGKALKALATHLGIPLSEVMAVGDGLNDITFLSIAGLAIAMQDAPDEVKKVADYITADVNHNGLAAAIDKFLLSKDKV